MANSKEHEGPKNMLPLNILDVLKKHTDENNRLSQKEIEDILQSDYGMKAGRKAIKRNLIELSYLGYDIEYTETPRNNKGGEVDMVCSDWYINRDITDAELLLLIESLLFSKYLPYSQCKRLIEKLTALSSIHFKERVKYIRSLPENQPENKQILYTIEILDKALAEKKKVSFHYTKLETNKQRHIIKNADETPWERRVSPYYI